MTEKYAVSVAIKSIEAHKQPLLSDDETLRHKELLRALESAKNTLKQVEYYGGTHSLIQKAAIASKGEELFPDTEN